MVLCLDIETERLAHEVGGWDNMLDLGVACAAVYDDATGETRVFEEATGEGEPLEALHGLLSDAARERTPVVGHNIRRFDLPLLDRAFADRGLLPALAGRLRTIDTLAHLKEATGRRVSLSNLAKRNDLGAKLMDGRDAPLLWRKGEHARVIAYCRRDVELQYALWRLGRDQGHVACWLHRDRRPGEDRAAYEAACLRKVKVAW